MSTFDWDSLDKSRGLAIWHVEDYLDLLRRRHPTTPGWRIRALQGIDNIPYTNVLPWETHFQAEYDVLPDGPVSLTGELLKEARAWGLEASWPDKAAFVRECRKCRTDWKAIHRRNNALQAVIQRIERELRTEENYKTVEGFVRQNRKEVTADFQDLLRAIPRGGRPFLPQVCVPPQETPAGLAAKRTTSPETLFRRKPEVHYSTEVVGDPGPLFSISAQRDPRLTTSWLNEALQERLREPERPQGFLQRLRRFFGGR